MNVDFAFAVRADQSDMLALQQAEGYIVEDRAVTEAVRQVFNGKNTHLWTPFSVEFEDCDIH